MPSKGALDPALFSDPDIGRCELGARLLLIGLYQQSQPDGSLVTSLRALTSSLFRYNDDVDGLQVEEWLRELEKAGAIDVVQHERADYLAIYLGGIRSVLEYGEPGRPV